MPETAEALIRRHLTDCLPPGSPLSFRAITSARFEGSGRRRKAIGELVMFDGLPATVEVFLAGQAMGVKMWGHCWTRMDGGPCSLEGNRWERIEPRQLQLFGDAA